MTLNFFTIIWPYTCSYPDTDIPHLEGAQDQGDIHEEGLNPMPPTSSGASLPSSSKTIKLVGLTEASD